MRHTVIYSRGTYMLGSWLSLDWSLGTLSKVTCFLGTGMMAKFELVPRLMGQTPCIQPGDKRKV